MVNLTYPQNEVGISYALVGLVLSGQATHQDIANSLYRASDEKLRLLYKSMQNTHTAHGVLKDVPFSRIVSLTQNLEGLVDMVLIDTFAALFPDFDPKADSPADIIKSFMTLLSDEQSPQALKVKAYGELILSSLRDKEAMAYAKEYRRKFADSGRLQAEDIVARDEMAAFLKLHIKTKLEETFPETRIEIGPMHGGVYRPLSEAIGGIF